MNRWSAVAMMLTSLFLISMIGCDSSLSVTDGDLDSVDGDVDLDTDADMEDDDPGSTDRERPEQESFVWQDDSIDRWRVTPFCLGGNVLINENFEDGETDTLPSWTLDPKVPSNPSGKPENVDPPAVVDEDESRGKVLSGNPEDTTNGKLTGRLYLPISPEVNSFHIMTRISGDEGENYLWLNHNSDISASFGPQIQIFHDSGLPPVEGGEAQWLHLDDETGITWAELDGLDQGWHRIELYHLDRKWRIDVDRITVAEFNKTLDPDRPLTHLFIGLYGRLDDIILGNCTPPPIGVACEKKEDCATRETCGRDGICNEIRAITCRSDIQCADGTKCLGERDEEDLLGDGTCSEVCGQHADCRPSEVCFPRTEEQGTCQQICESHTDCPEDQSCYLIGGVKACAPDMCKENGHWLLEPNGLMDCACRAGFVLNPFNNRCEDLGVCTSHADCGEGEACDGESCHKSRDESCFSPDECLDGMTCYSNMVNDFPTGIGQCLADCKRDSDCLDYEACVPATPIQWACLQKCDSDEDCASSMVCVEGYSSTYCMSAKCQEFGVWSWDPAAKTFVCTCTDGKSPDPISGGCY